MKILSPLAVLLTTAGASQALEVQKVTDVVYALVGDMGQRSAENLGNNATFGVIVTDDGVILIDAGGSWNGAREIETAIAGITDQPVRYVINSGGQDHRWLGNGFWKSKGATIIASEHALADHQERGSFQMSVLDQLIGEQLDGTEPVYADETFAQDYHLELGGTDVEIAFRGQAHTPGDAFMWLPSEKSVFTGDIVYVDRILGVGEQSHSGDWIDVFDAMSALEPEHLIPGHGPATDLATAKADTYDYLVNLRTEMAAYMDDGGDIIGSVDVDQSAFSDLLQFEQLAKRNAQQVFSEMEFE